MVDIEDALLPIEREAAKERQGERTDKHLGKFSGRPATANCRQGSDA
jgi:hypothetical protein